MLQAHPSVDLYDLNSRDNCPDWVSELPDYLSISHISIPGTNGSCSKKTGHMHQTQAWDLDKQLSNGVRLIEVRCRLGSDRSGADVLNIYEYRAKQNVNFEESLLGVCIQFLNTHDQEFILLMITDMDNRGTRFSRCLQELCKPANRFWLNGPRPMPTVEDARGRIVILRNFKGTIGVPVENLVELLHEPVVNTILPISCGKESRKWRQIEIRLNKLFESTQRRVDPRNPRDEGQNINIHVTFITGSSFLAYPYAVAGRINPLLDKYLEDKKNALQNQERELIRNGIRIVNTFGCIVMDYPSVSLVRRIIDTNFPSRRRWQEQ